MPRLRKDVLKPATYSVPDRSGKKRHRVEFTGADITHLLTRYKEMQAAGLHVPVSWNHQDEAKPKADRLADRAKHVLGWAEDAQVVGDTLEFDLDIPDDADAKQAKTARYVSPEMVTDWVDGSGRVWPGRSITHIAVTAMPVQANQKPFEQLSIIRLSLADLEPDAMTINLKPMLAYLAKRKITLPEGTPADKLLRRLNVVRLGYEEGEESEDKAETETEAEGEKDVPGSGKEAMFKKVMEYLQGQGIHLPEDTDKSNFIERLCVACHALENSSGDSDVETPNPNDPANTPQPADISGGGMMMSLQRELADEKKKTASLSATLLKTEKENLARRIEKLPVSKPMRDKLAASLKTERLSLADDGSLSASDLVLTVKAYEALDNDSISPVQLSLDRSRQGGTPSAVPDPDDGSKLDESVMSRLTGGRYSAPNGKGK